MERGNIVSWKVKEGDAIAPGDLLAEIETDKAVLGFENQEEGFIAKILVPAGARDIPVNSLVAIVVEEAASVPAFKDYAPPGQGPAKGTAAAPAPAAAQPPPPPQQQQAGAGPSAAANFRLGPAARMALAEAGLTPADITRPTGPNGIVTKADVLAAVAAGVKPGSGSRPAAAAAAAPPPAQPQQRQPAAAAAAKPAAAPAAATAAAAAAPGPRGPQYADTPNSQIRKVIASRLLDSKRTTPGLYLSVDTSLDALNELRQMLAAQGMKVSINDFVLKAVAAALQDVPAANASWDPKKQEPVLYKSVDVCVAVATDKGLITPIVKDADKKGLQQISKDVRDLALRARAGTLKPEEFMGGSFTVSNLGMYGVEHFAAIINPPQAGILAVGGSQQRVVLRNGVPVATTAMTVTLSADHRVHDGELAAAFLKAFKAAIEAPAMLLSRG